MHYTYEDFLERLLDVIDSVLRIMEFRQQQLKNERQHIQNRLDHLRGDGIFKDGAQPRILGIDFLGQKKQDRNRLKKEAGHFYFHKVQFALYIKRLFYIDSPLGDLREVQLVLQDAIAADRIGTWAAMREYRKAEQLKSDENMIPGATVHIDWYKDKDKYVIAMRPSIQYTERGWTVFFDSEEKAISKAEELELVVSNDESYP